MTMMIQEEQAVSLYFAAESFFANRVQVTDFQVMESLLEGECLAFSLPCNILLWHSPQAKTDNEHTISVQRDNQVCAFYGACLLTSDDAESLNGFKGLSDEQHNWLSKHHRLVESSTGQYSIQFIIQ